MRQFAKVQATLYTGGTGRALRALKDKRQAKDSLLLMPYLVVGPSANQFGLYQLELELVSTHLPLNEAEILSAIGQLEALNFCRFDVPTRWLWVVEMAGYQLDAPLKPQDNVVRSVKRWYETAPRNPFLGPFYDHYAFDLCLGVSTERSGGPVDRRDNSKPLRRASEGAPEPPVSVLSQSQFPPSGVVGGAGEDGGFELQAPPTGPKPVPRPWREEFFERFWTTYPKATDKRPTWEAFCKAAKTPEVAEEIVTSLQRLLPHFTYRDGGRYIPAPWRWLQNEKWKDVPAELPDMNGRTEQTARAVAKAAQRGAPR